MSDPQALTTNAFPQNTGLKAAVAVLSLVFFVFTALYVYFKKEGKATYAIVLVPGYGQKSLSQSALLQSLALLPSCRVAGAFRTGASGRMLPPIIDGDPANTLYALDFDENLWKNGDIKTVSEKLAAYIDLIPCDSLVLVGYSMGGIVCRQYLATVPENKSAKVKALISIASPHRGTYWADAAALSDSLLGGFLSGRLADKLQVSYGMNMVAQMKTGNGFMKGLDESYIAVKKAWRKPCIYR